VASSSKLTRNTDFNGQFPARLELVSTHGAIAFG
jgi:hypothetical protein